MRLSAFILIIPLHPLVASALNVQFKTLRRPHLHKRGTPTFVEVTRPDSPRHGGAVVAAAGGVDGNKGLDINSLHDLLYIANITVGGNDYPLQLDTGSSDLWIKGPSSPLPNTNQTPTTYNLTYGIGWAYGHVAYAPVQFAGIPVQSQAFLDVSSAENPALGYGAEGVLGLGFTSLSTIDALINRTSASSGRSLLYNLFAARPNEPNFIGFLLQRTTDSPSQGQGSFAIGEYVPRYAGIANTPAIPTWPPRFPKRWTTLMESFIVHGRTVPVSSQVPGAPSNKAVALLDSGTSYTYAPVEACNAIYKEVPGASYDSTLGQWKVPCDAEIDMAIQFGGHVFPVHPLDMTPHGILDPSICVGSFIPQPVSIAGGQFDWLIGDNFLRGVYSIYDFGDFNPSGGMGDPYIKLLSIIDPNVASQEFHSVRGGTPSGNITYNASNPSSGSGSTTVTVSDKVAATLDKIGTYVPIALGILALNALVIMLLLIVGIVLLCRGKGRSCFRSGTVRRKMTRTGINKPRRFEDMPMNPSISISDDQAQHSPLTHPYQPISMAITDDTVFSPVPGSPTMVSPHSPTTPAPATLRKWNPESLSPLSPSDRPRTTIFSGAPADTPRRRSAATTDEMIFTPPSPGFRMVENERPKSIA